MDLKMKLQRVLQIVEESERVGALSDLERDIILNDLREVYAELRFGKMVRESESTIPTTHIEPTIPAEEEQEETEEKPEVEVELIFDEESDDEAPIVEEEATAEKCVVEEPVVAQPVVEEPVVEEDELSTFHTPLSTPKRSPLLSLYEDEAAKPIVGEQFCERPSVADAITCPKGVAESTPVASLRTAIGVADRFLLINELFAGDSNAYESAIDVLDAQPSLDDCVIYISENYSWRANAEGTKLIMTLLQRKYNE